MLWTAQGAEIQVIMLILYKSQSNLKCSIGKDLYFFFPSSDNEQSSERIYIYMYMYLYRGNSFLNCLPKTLLYVKKMSIFGKLQTPMIMSQEKMGMPSLKRVP